MIVFIYNYIRDENMVDGREIHTRRHDGILFKTFTIEHYKVRQDPIVKATLAWNALPLQIRGAENKSTLKGLLAAMVPNPYSNLL